MFHADIANCTRTDLHVVRDGGVDPSLNNSLRPDSEIRQLTLVEEPRETFSVEVASRHHSSEDDTHWGLKISLVFHNEGHEIVPFEYLYRLHVKAYVAGGEHLLQNVSLKHRSGRRVRFEDCQINLAPGRVLLHICCDVTRFRGLDIVPPMHFIGDFTVDDAPVEIRVQGLVLHSTRRVLASNSDVFSAMFTHDTIERRDNAVNIWDACPLVVQDLIRYFHRAPINLARHPAQLLELADRYFVESLVFDIEEYFFFNVDIRNVLFVMVISDLYRLPNLRDRCIRYARDLGLL